MHPRLISVLACPNCLGRVRAEGDRLYQVILVA